MRTKLLGNLGAWLCNRFTPRHSTQAENQFAQDNAEMMKALLKVKNGICDAKTALRELSGKKWIQ